jgi:hypothetical protein
MLLHDVALTVDKVEVVHSARLPEQDGQVPQDCLVSFHIAELSFLPRATSSQSGLSQGSARANPKLESYGRQKTCW